MEIRFQLEPTLLLALAFVFASSVGCSEDGATFEGGPEGVADPVTPAERGGAPAAWLPTTGEMVIFGGMDPITNDTFSLVGARSEWRELTPERAGAVPAPRCHHTLTELRADDAAILFGGFSRAGRFNDTWRFDADTETWAEINTSGTIPARRCLHATVLIESRNELLVYGGIAGSGTRQSEFFGDTHVLDLETSNWTHIEGDGPSPREGTVMVYSASTDAVLLWGGKAFDHYPVELWRFDVAERTWSIVPTVGATPVGREDPTYFWDEARGRLTLFSGRNDLLPVVLLDDGYELDVMDRSWAAIDTSGTPPPRWRSSAAVDRDGDQGYMFGGWRDFGGAEAFNDTWRYDLQTRGWTQLP